MSRLEEALRRSRTRPASDTFNGPSHKALDWFAGSNDAAPLRPEEPSLPLHPPRSPASGAGVRKMEAESSATGGRALSPRVAPPGPPLTHALTHEGGSALGDRLILNHQLDALAAEQYRRIAAALHLGQRERGIKVVMVTSALASEGKTLNAANLALTISESYRRRVLLIDADLRRPMVHSAFNVPNEEGLNSVLNASEDRRLNIVAVTTHLAVLPSGRPDPDPVSGLTSPRMRRVIAEAAEKFDWVIIDTPPVGLLPDANLLAAFVDVAVLVVAAGRTRLETVQKAVGAIGRERIIGVILNRTEPGGAKDDYGARYYRNYPGGDTGPEAPGR